MLIAYTAGTKQSDAPSPVCCDEISDSLLHLLLQTQECLPCSILFFMHLFVLQDVLAMECSDRKLGMYLHGSVSSVVYKNCG